MPMPTACGRPISQLLAGAPGVARARHRRHAPPRRRPVRAVASPLADCCGRPRAAAAAGRHAPGGHLARSAAGLPVAIAMRKCSSYARRRQDAASGRRRGYGTGVSASAAVSVRRTVPVRRGRHPLPVVGNAATGGRAVGRGSRPAHGRRPLRVHARRAGDRAAFAARAACAAPTARRCSRPTSPPSTRGWRASATSARSSTSTSCATLPRPRRPAMAIDARRSIRRRVAAGTRGPGRGRCGPAVAHAPRAAARPGARAPSRARAARGVARVRAAAASTRTRGQPDPAHPGSARPVAGSAGARARHARPGTPVPGRDTCILGASLDRGRDLRAAA